jgi:hypothetical protein
MNRRDRRAAAARGQPSGEALQRGPVNTSAFGAENGSSAPAAAKPSWVLRLVARILLSRWLLARVKNPEVERMLISMAMEAGRTEVADELIRRQTMRAR